MRALGVVLLGVVCGLSACGDANRTSLSPIPPLASSRSGADLALYPQPGRVEYTVRGTLPSVASHAVTYTMAATTSPDRVAKLARAFGIAGVVTADASGWSATSGDIALHVQRFGGLPWTVTRMGGDGTVSSGCAVASPANRATTSPPPTCPTTTTAPGLPAKGEAEGIARSVLMRAGIDVTHATAVASGSSTQWSVSFSIKLAGVPLTATAWTVGVGPHGATEYASGYLADPAAAGDYSLVGIAAGLERLKKGPPWLIYGRSGPVPMMGVASGGDTVAATKDAGAATNETASPPTATAATSCAPDTPCSSPGAPPAEPPAPIPCSAASPCPTVTEPPPTVMTITGVHLGLGWATPADPRIADAWLVPVYVFEIDGGTTIPVLAVADALLGTTTVVPASKPTR